MTHTTFVLGGRGLLAGELIRLIVEHPKLQLEAVYSRQAGDSIGTVHRFLSGGPAELEFEEPSELEQALLRRDSQPCLLFLALPHGVSAHWWQQTGQRLAAKLPKLSIVDLSADFRLQSAEAYQATYQATHPCSDELGTWSYGLPELHPVPLAARKIAAPGCFATALQLSLAPLRSRSDLLHSNAPWVAQAVTGSSGSGAVASSTTHHPTRDGNYRAYALQGHRHLAEWSAPRNGEANDLLTFTPHSGPFKRGIHLHAVLQLKNATAGTEACEQLQAWTQTHRFVDWSEQAPELREVVGSNRLLLHAQAHKQVLHVLAVLDNSLKGGAGQAIQAFNLSQSWDEGLGLPIHAWGY